MNCWNFMVLFRINEKKRICNLNFGTLMYLLLKYKENNKIYDRIENDVEITKLTRALSFNAKYVYFFTKILPCL